MILEEQQDSTGTFGYDEINDLPIDNEPSNVETMVENKDNSDKKHKCRFARKFSAGTKLIFWAIMLILALILGIESIWIACSKIEEISELLNPPDGENVAVGEVIKQIFVAIFAWIEAMFYIIIFSWSIFGVIKNGVIFSKTKKIKKAKDGKKDKDDKKGKDLNSNPNHLD